MIARNGGTPLKRCFVQFMHPGREHRPDGEGLKSWNVDEHRRKFLLGEGTYRESSSGPAHSGPLVFWGEWEPESSVRRLSATREPGAPRWLHEPYYLRPASYRRDGRPLQNTDPFVFGDRFLYTICRQYTRGAGGEWRPTFLHDLARGSVILFGSHYRREFVLDTVFVVGDSVVHTATDWRRSLAGRVNDVYSDVTIGPLREDVGPIDKLRLYLGATPEAPVDGMFSFFPCLPADGEPRGFARPPIRLRGLITPTQTMGMKGKVERSSEEVKEAWDSVVSQVVGQELMLGVHVSLPPRRGSAGARKREGARAASGGSGIRC